LDRSPFLSQSADGNRIPDRLEVSVKLIPSFGPALVILSLQGVARAQTLHVPPVEIGGQTGLIGAIAEGVYIRPIAGPRLTLNISQQDAIELAADTLVPNDGPGIYGLYFLQYKRTIRRPPDWSGIRRFLSVGTGGYYSYRKVPERRSPRPDGSVVIYPAHSSGELSRLTLVAFGGGFERGLNRYVSFRLEGSGFVVIHSDGYLGFLALAGMSVPIGGYRASASQ
jgi:hypothetical protein